MSRAWILKLPPRKQTNVCVDCYNKCFFCRRINRPPLFWMPPIKLLVISSFEYTTTIYHPFILELILWNKITTQYFVFQVVTMPVTQAYTRMTQILIVMVASPDMKPRLFWSHLFDLYNDNVSQWTLLCLVSYTFALLYIRIHLNTSHHLLLSFRQHAFTTIPTTPY